MARGFVDVVMSFKTSTKMFGAILKAFFKATSKVIKTYLGLIENLTEFIFKIAEWITIIVVISLGRRKSGSKFLADVEIFLMGLLIFYCAFKAVGLTSKTIDVLNEASEKEYYAYLRVFSFIIIMLLLAVFSVVIKSSINMIVDQLASD